MSNYNPLPQDLGVERAVLAAILVTPERLPEIEFLNEDCFTLPAHKALWCSLKRLAEAGTPIDPITVRDDLVRHGELTDVDRLDFLMNLPDSLPSAAHVQHYARIIVEMTARRGIMAQAARLYNLAKDATQPLDGAVSTAVQNLKNLSSNYTCNPLELQSLRLRETDAVDLAAEGGPPGIPPSLPLLGLPGYVVEGWGHIVSGYPKSGKTELVYACVRDWLIEGHTVLWLSEESESVWRHRLAKHPLTIPGLRLVFALGAEPDKLLDRAAEGEESVIIIDTIRSLMRLADENDNAAIARVLGVWEARLQGRTRVYLHHQRKLEGDHGQAIAGGGAFLGCVDRAIEITFDPHSPNRRKLTVRSRICEAPDLLYELVDDKLVALGSPTAVAIDAVSERILAVLDDDEWRTTKEIGDLLDAPKPSVEQLRTALNKAREQGQVSRQPEDDRPGATYRWRRGKTSPPTGGTYTWEVRLQGETSPPPRPTTSDEHAANPPPDRCTGCGAATGLRDANGAPFCENCYPLTGDPLLSAICDVFRGSVIEEV